MSDSKARRWTSEQEQPQGSRPTAVKEGPRPTSRSGRETLQRGPHRLPRLSEVRGPGRPRRSEREHDLVEADDSAHRAAIILFGVGVALVSVALVREATVASKGPERPAAANESLLGPVSARRRMDNHILDAAAKIESDRIAAELAAEKARVLLSEGVPQPLPDVVTLGVPLKTQAYHLSQADLDRMARRGAEKADRAEARIREGVKEDRDAVEWEASAQRMYVADFIRNARDAGWDVRVDKNLNVVYRRIEEDEGGARMPQSLAGSDSSEVRASLFAPYCPRLGR